MSAPVRIVYGARNTYRLDPYVRDARGRFAPVPDAPPPPLEDLTHAGRVVTLFDGRVMVAPDTAYWVVRCVRDTDGSYRVVYCEG